MNFAVVRAHLSDRLRNEDTGIEMIWCPGRASVRQPTDPFFEMKLERPRAENCRGGRTASGDTSFEVNYLTERQNHPILTS